MSNFVGTLLSICIQSINVYINFHEYVNETTGIYYIEIKGCVIAISWHHVCYLRAIIC